jgi:pimeloyl-ACP methyl ester carboxylesterase
MSNQDGITFSSDGVSISYLARGNGDVALVFIHGGFADKTFWSEQVTAFAKEYRVVTVDLAGHGDSGSNRSGWTLDAFGEDVQAVANELDLERMVLIGNSLGGPVALQVATILPERVLGVVGVDTLHDAGVQRSKEQWQARIDAFRKDFDGVCEQFARSLFQEGADPDLVREVTQRMCEFSPEIAVALLESFINYDMAAAMRAVQAPIRCINADLYPTNIEGNRRYSAGFDAVIMEGVGHYPMLERPDEFNGHLDGFVREMRGG